MWPRRIAVGVVLLVSAFCLALAVFIFVNFARTRSSDDYPVLLIGLAMLYMGGAMLVGVFRPAKAEDPDAPIEIPPLDQVRGRTSYRDSSAKWRNVVLAIGVIFLAASLTAAPDQPAVLVIALIAVGVLCGAGVMTWRQIQYGRARLELERPARRGDLMRGVITTSGFGWTVADRDFEATVEVSAIRTYGKGQHSNTSVVAQTNAITSVTRDGKDMTFRFSVTVPIIETSERRISWNVQLETESTVYRVTFLVDVA